MARSFFERLTGSRSLEDELENLKDQNPFMYTGDEEEPGQEKEQRQGQEGPEVHTAAKKKEKWLQNAEEAQLTIDAFQTPNEIVIQAMVGGVKPEDLDVSITQDMVNIRGKRERTHEVSKDNFYYQELYWGSFNRSLMLPQEVDVDASEAVFKNGLLTIKMPKLDKNRSQKIKIKQE